MIGQTFSPAWNAFATHQTELLAAHKITPRTLGDEEALVEILDDLGRGALSDAESVHRRFGFLEANRATKYRRRAGIEGERVDGNDAPASAPDPTETIALRQLAVRALAGVCPRDGQALWALADGASYREVAARYGLTETNLKARISRIRARLRRSPTGAGIMNSPLG